MTTASVMDNDGPNKNRIKMSFYKTVLMFSRYSQLNTSGPVLHCCKLRLLMSLYIAPCNKKVVHTWILVSYEIKFGIIVWRMVSMNFKKFKKSKMFIGVMRIFSSFFLLSYGSSLQDTYYHD